jgi:hypothetical protein
MNFNEEIIFDDSRFDQAKKLFSVKARISMNFQEKSHDS